MSWREHMDAAQEQNGPEDMIPEEVLHHSTEGPICPHCGHRHRADEAFYFDESMTAMDCEACELDFEVRVHTSTSWTTQPRR